MATDKNIGLFGNVNQQPVGAEYEKASNFLKTRGLDTSVLNSGETYVSAINKIHLIRLANDFPAYDSGMPDFFARAARNVKTLSELCKMESGAQQYDADDFLYCKNIGYPLNHLITLRRFVTPCTDNIWDKESQGEPDISRMITYFDQEQNKLDELLSFSYATKWKELTAEMEQASMQGDQAGLSGMMGKVMSFVDPVMYNDVLRGDNSQMVDPKFDQNKVYGPVNSIINTHIRDVGLEFNKEFEITFPYELKSINGRSPEYAFKDILANVLACTYETAQFWPGSRYWVGKRPSSFLQHFQWMNSGDIDKVLFNAINDLKGFLGSMATKGSALDTLKKAMTGAFHMALGKMLDKVGRPGIIMMNSLLSGEPTGYWHLTVGNPTNPILCIGNLICTGVDVSFPTDTLSYGEFPDRMTFKVKLKPGQPKDRAGAEMMFNTGKSRIYYAPTEIKVNKNKLEGSNSRGFFGYDDAAVNRLLSEAYDFLPVKTVMEGGQKIFENVTVAGNTTSGYDAKTLNTKGNNQTESDTKNSSKVKSIGKNLL